MDELILYYNRYFSTFPYPYMNGRLHLGHTFTLAKVDFTSKYQAMIGKDSLFPFSFHTTGMPIKASADKIKGEIERFGNPPIFPQVELNAEEVQNGGNGAENGPKKFTAKKTKTEQKSAGVKYQWEIMESMDVARDEIAKFAEPMHWARYFPSIAMSDLKKFGVGVDWRRSFFTTELNPYYDAFIQWQFRTLKNLDKIKFGKRNTIYSVVDRQPCADHDRATGEGIQPQEYSGIKMLLKEPYPKCIEDALAKDETYADHKIFLVAATLRPETMFGQTNYWVHPEATYGVFEGIHGEKELYLCSEHAARNMAHQDLSPAFGVVKKITDVPGMDLIGTLVESPNAPKPIRGLPMIAVSMEKGTGVVTCVPSDAPDDYISIEDLRNKPAFREKYSVKEEWVDELELIEIIETMYGRRSAEVVCKEMKIKSQGERSKLEKAKELVYKEGFYKGVMTVPGLENVPVSEAKQKIKDEMHKKRELLIYVEPEREVISRSGDKCIVASVDQWYLNYGEDEWKAQVSSHLCEEMEFYNAETKQAHEIALDWLKNWACSRSFGLGTYLPWDKKYVIESLSDSTIYMAYYTIAHLIQNGSLDSSSGTLNVDDLSDEFFDYVFLGKEPCEAYISREGNTITRDLMDKCRNEYLYWYPMDLRVSGKDLIQNHLTMSLYNHAAVLGVDMMPRSFKTNGFVLLNGEKMAKQTGNFLTLDDTIHRFGADATKIGLADGGDTNDDANFEVPNADSAVLKLYHLIDWSKEIKDQIEKGKLRDGPLNFHDEVFMSQMGVAVKGAKHGYEMLSFRDALRCSFHELLNNRDKYRNAVAEDINMHKDVFRKYLEVQSLLIAPIASHVAEYIWKDILQREGFILRARFPEVDDFEIDSMILQKNDYLEFLLSHIRQRMKRELQVLQKRAKKSKTQDGKAELPKMENLIAYFTDLYPEFEANIRDIVRPFYDKEKGELPPERELLEVLKKDERIEKKMLKKAMVEIKAVKDDLKEFGPRALDVKISFDEFGTAQENLVYIRRCLGFKEVKFCKKEDESAPDPGKRKDIAKPGKPATYFY